MTKHSVVLREKYFTPDTIRTRSVQWAGEFKSLREKHLHGLSSDPCALLVLDMQKYFLEASSHAFVPSAAATVPGIQKLIHAFRQSERPVVFTRHINTAANAGMMSSWWRDLIADDSERSEIIPDLDQAKGMLVNKNQYDAFFQSPLDGILAEQGVKQVVICGVMTHLCCETTARSAFMRGYQVLFTIDGTATYNEEFHRATLLNLAHGFAPPVLIDEILEQL